ncbi:hypothetical protein CSIM01_09156 [Colletotrichum simmondsii]|uniref:Uncharacterized protein n=1 Tax=Colletotrichum simmondsii TaxID=703756 RepID=A0A135TWR5_9PEZI|nr:hypothetical protein CSIM01_09156 [Colletotrichum simmondsii]
MPSRPPSILFSAKQRQVEPNKRICIGREGHIRLCEHRTFGWDEFVHTSSATNADTSITCNHPDHLGASKKPVGLRVRLGMSPHRAVTGTGTPSEVQATFEHTNNYASWASEIDLDKEAHVKIPAYKLRSQPGSLLLASDLRQVLETQRGQSPCPWFPEEGPRQIDAMACFKPFRCICVVDENERERIQQECIAGPFSWNPSANECPRFGSLVSQSSRRHRVQERDVVRGREVSEFLQVSGPCQRGHLDKLKELVSQTTEE